MRMSEVHVGIEAEKNHLKKPNVCSRIFGDKVEQFYLRIGKIDLFALGQVSKFRMEPKCRFKISDEKVADDEKVVLPRKKDFLYMHQPYS